MEVEHGRKWTTALWLIDARLQGAASRGSPVLDFRDRQLEFCRGVVRGSRSQCGPRIERGKERQSAHTNGHRPEKIPTVASMGGHGSLLFCLARPYSFAPSGKNVSFKYAFDTAEPSGE